MQSFPQPADDANEPSDVGSDVEGAGDEITKLRVWPIFVASLAEVVFVALLQGVVIVAVFLATRPEGKTIQAAISGLPALLMTPPIFVLMLVVSGASIMVAAFVFGSISARNQGISVSQRLGLQWPKISAGTLVCFLLGSIPVLLVSVGAVVLIAKVIPADESALGLYKNMTNGWAIVFIILIGVLPGFGEELFFRGFVQRRMLQRYRPWVAIGVTSFIFGVFHVTPHGIALATIIGVWLGVIAWRTNSIWPGACCHAFINSGWNVYQVGHFQWGFPEIPPVWLCVVGGAVVLAAFALSVRILHYTKLSGLPT